ncbi:putative metallopeptidase [Bacillus phage Novomoskovsk]|uniref:Putative metallopeptidase n=1 Tax=Bacillus phage Novomoskovsk TaxID=2736258 RepID=A0A6M9Z6H6_9CAUD|nr:putative metallopeptidase [Bacillus phage Novomoskovsk]
MTYLEEVNGRSITVRNIEYTIEVLSEEEIDEVNGYEVFGLAYDKESKIYLREGMSDRRAQQTLIHEVLHAMFFESGYTFEDKEQEEAIVTSLSLVMHDMVNTGGLTFSLDEEVSFEAKDMLARENDKKIYLESVEQMEINGEKMYAGAEPLFKLPKFFKSPQSSCDNKPFKKSTDEKTFYYVETPERLFKISSEEYGKLLESTHNLQFFDLLTSSYFDIPISSIVNVSKVKPFKEEK